jgi:phage terminase small subunit
VKLTVKQKAFADYYIELGNATESYIKAGYKASERKVAEVEGCKLLKNPKIDNYIKKRMEQIESNRIAKAEEVLAFLSASLRGEVLEEVVSTKSDGSGGIEPVILRKQLSAKDRIKAAELLGKRYALFTEKVDLEGNVGVTIIDDIGALEDE